MSATPTPLTFRAKVAHYWFLALVALIWIVGGGLFGIRAVLDSDELLAVKFVQVCLCGLYTVLGLYLSALALLAPFSVWAADRVEIEKLPTTENPGRPTRD